MPTVVPTAAFSSTASGARSMSLIAPTSNSSRSFTPMTKSSEEMLPSLEAASTLMVWLLASSASMRAGHGHHPGDAVDGEAGPRRHRSRL